MRDSDEPYLIGSKHKYIGDQNLVGPFTDKQVVEEWLKGFIAMHGKNRHTKNFTPDCIDPYH